MNPRQQSLARSRGPHKLHKAPPPSRNACAALDATAKTPYNNCTWATKYYRTGLLLKVYPIIKPILAHYFWTETDTIKEYVCKIGIRTSPMWTQSRYHEIPTSLLTHTANANPKSPDAAYLFSRSITLNDFKVYLTACLSYMWFSVKFTVYAN